MSAGVQVVAPGALFNPLEQVAQLVDPADPA
jgi:hypothetical protein